MALDPPPTTTNEPHMKSAVPMARSRYHRAMKKLWGRLGTSSRVALISGVVLAVASIPLPAWLALIVGLLAAAVLGYAFPGDAIRVGIMVAVPILSVALLVGVVRGISLTVIVVFLACSLILPISLAKLGAGAREGRLGS
jgi:hypothetical protein